MTVAYIAVACRCCIGVVFAVSAFTKLRGRAAFRRFTFWLGGLPLPVARSRPAALAAAMAVTEAAAAALVALPWTAWPGLALAALLLLVLAAGTWLAVARGADAPCECFGRSAAPLGARHVVRNVVLCGLALTGIAGAGLAGAEPGGVAVSAAAGLVAAVCTVFLDDVVMLLRASAPPPAGASRPGP